MLDMSILDEETQIVCSQSRSTFHHVRCLSGEPQCREKKRRRQDEHLISTHDFRSLVIADRWVNISIRETVAREASKLRSWEHDKQGESFVTVSVSELADLQCSYMVELRSQDCRRSGGSTKGLHQRWRLAGDRGGSFHFEGRAGKSQLAVCITSASCRFPFHRSQGDEDLK